MSATRKFEVAIYANEYKQICGWVLENADLQTGGDLFGLWSGNDSAVIQLVLGPGRNCRRTATSFYQDVDYLGKVGSYLTKSVGVCHIGDWHSHHTIGLQKPSGGDEGAVWRNLRQYGVSRFLLFIANIEPLSGSDVSVGCFLFEFERGTNRKLPVIQGKFRLLLDESPFRSELCLEELRKGCEFINSDEQISKSFSEAVESSAMRPVMTRTQKRPAASPSKDQEPVTPDKNESEVELEIAGENFAANETKLCVVA